ncbi:MAG: hypothetical protein L0170_13755 [Acidobacteria bacterium]|nr:hypothetical protein [Acidobacteriota bacterium]
MPVVTRLPRRLGIILPSREPARPTAIGIVPARNPPGSTGLVHSRVPRQHRGPLPDAPAPARPLELGHRLTVEEVDEVWAYCTTAAFRKHRAGLVRLAEWVAVEGDQEAVAILVDNGMELVTEKETS